MLTEQSLLLFIVCMAGGFSNGMGGSGGLLIVPYMMSVGISPATALATARFAAIPSHILTVWNFNKANQVVWSSLPVLSVLAVVGGLIGTQLIIDIPEQYIYPIIGIVLLALVAFVLLDKGWGVDELKQRKPAIGYASYFISMIYAGFFGAGASLMLVFSQVKFLGFKAMQAHATDTLIWIIMSIFSVALFWWYGKIKFDLCLSIFLGMSIGSYLGSKVAIKGGDVWVKYVILLFATIMGVKFLFFS